MVGLGTIFVAIATLARCLLWRKRLFERARAALGVDAGDAVSVHRERSGLGGDRGRAPTVDHLRPDAHGRRRARRHVAGGETVFTLIGFAGMYFLLGVLFLYLVLREIALGPSAA